MTPDLDFEEAARLMERACDLLLFHRYTHPGVAYYIRQWPGDMRGLRSMARRERETQSIETRKLFA